MPATDPTPWWEIAGALAAVVGALAAAAGAMAAWRAASASRATSRDALDALALGIAPTVTAKFPQLHRGNERGQPRPPKWVAWLTNESDFPAVDVSIEVRFRDGRTVRDRTERLAPSRGVDPLQGGEHHEVILGDAPLGGPSIEQLGQEAVLRYSDERRIARYEQRYGFLFRQHQDGTVTSTLQGIETGERERIK